MAQRIYFSIVHHGPCYLSKKLAEYLEEKGMTHTRGKPFHPMTQGKIERYYRSLKNEVLMQHYYLPEELEREIAHFVEYYNNKRYHESLNNLTPADVYSGRAREIETRREKIKRESMEQRRRCNPIVIGAASGTMAYFKPLLRRRRNHLRT